MVFVDAIRRIEQHHKRKAEGTKMTSSISTDFEPTYSRRKRRKMNQESYKP
jgi:hypothetical protein